LITVSLPRLPAALTSLLLTIQPVGSVALAAAIFGESPTLLQLGGVGLVLVALIVATTRLASGMRSAGRVAYALAGGGSAVGDGARTAPMAQAPADDPLGVDPNQRRR
jgi:drug/metabolite transporter (DMT)-like permease